MQEELRVSKSLADKRIERLTTQLADRELGGRKSWDTRDVGPMFERVDNLRDLLVDMEQESAQQVCSAPVRPIYFFVRMCRRLLLTRD